MPKTNHPELTKQVNELAWKLQLLKGSAAAGGMPDMHIEQILVWFVEAIEEDRELRNAD